MQLCPPQQKGEFAKARGTGAGKSGKKKKVLLAAGKVGSIPKVFQWLAVLLMASHDFTLSPPNSNKS
ncbi:MAG: hypothetical protein ACKO2G_02865 [Verrucomicrobiales bacterium]